MFPRRKIVWTFAFVGIFILTASFCFSCDLGLNEKDSAKGMGGERGAGGPPGEADQQDSGRRKALVIGNNAYQGKPLRNAVNDARSMRTVLRRLGYSVSLAEDTDKEELERAVRSFIGSLEGGDTAFFFYSGHGMQIDGENFMLPVDFDAVDDVEAKYQSYSAELVRERMERSGARLRIIVLDACRNNPYSAARSSSRGLAAMNAGRGTFIAFATGPSKVASDNPRGNNGLYTHYLLESLEIPGLKIEEVFKRVGEKVYQASNGQQEPWTASSIYGVFYFVPPSGAQPPTGEEPPRTEVGSEAAVGTIKVTVYVAGAEVLIDGLRIATSSKAQTLNLTNIPIGYRRVSVRKEGYRSDVVNKQVLVRVGQATRLEAILEPERKAARDVITNSVGMDLKLIPAGSFIMGASPEDGDAQSDEKPQHRVEITKAFYIGVYEVTQAQWEAVMGKNPSHFKGSRRPVENVSWNDAKEFCRRLSQKEGVTYRLPTEAEWEYACRAGTATKYYWGDNMDGDYAWYSGNSDDKTHEVGRKQPNSWGLYDMSGNVWEWCEDWYDEDYYSSSPRQDPQGPSSGQCRVLRGGGWGGDVRLVRSSLRVWYRPVLRYDNLGFRIVREVE